MLIPVLLAAATIAQDNAPPIRSSFVAKGWFMQHMKGWEAAKIEEIRPVAYGDWTTGGGLLGSPLLSAGWSPAKHQHLAMIHCWRVTPAGQSGPKTYMFAEALNGAILKVKISRDARPSKEVARRCGG